VLVIDPIAGPLVRAIYGFPWITPDLVTAASFAVGAGAAASFAAGHLVVGGLLFQLSFLLDCIDGKLAWTRKQESPHGACVDAFGDAGRFVLCTGGLVYALAASETNAPVWVALYGLFPAIHYARLITQAALPKKPSSEPVEVTPSPLAFLRAARRRLSAPGTTVDTEALAFTIGPVFGFPLYGLVAAAVVDSARLLFAAGVISRRVAAGGSPHR
jgi:phosphatidylglycerophosphate synthase